MTRDGDYKYEVALSFAGEDREYVEAVAVRLRAAGVPVFYDGFEEAALWGKDLYAHLDDVYRLRARYCVMFISQHYREKLWTNHERESAQARAFQENEEYLLPARFDDTDIPGVRPTIGYVDLRRYKPAAFAELVLQKLGREAGKETVSSPDESGFRTPRVAQKNFNPYREAERLIEHLAEGFEKRCETLEDRGITFARVNREGRTCLRVVHHGEVRYGLDIWMGGMSSDHSLAFAFHHGEPSSFGSGMNAWGEVIWSQTADGPAFKMFNMSLVGHMGQNIELSYEQLLDELWGEACKAVEGSW